MTASYQIMGVLVDNKVVVRFFVDGKYYNEMRGSNGTGVKFYPTLQAAKEAGRRYLRTMKKRGFIVED